MPNNIIPSQSSNIDLMLDGNYLHGQQSGGTPYLKELFQIIINSINAFQSELPGTAGASLIGVKNTNYLNFGKTSNDVASVLEGIDNAFTNLSLSSGIYKQAIINGNFDNWHYGINFVNPSNNTAILLPDYYIRKADGSGTAPSVNVQRSTTVPDYRSAYSLSLNVTSTGTAGGGMHWYIEYVMESDNAAKFIGQNASCGLMVRAPFGAFFKLVVFDGVSTFSVTDTGNASFKHVTLNNMSISPSSTGIVVRLYIAENTNLPTIGLYYFSQLQFNRGASLFTFSPNLGEYEQALGLARKRMDNIGVNLVASINSMIVPTSSAHTVLNTSFVKQSYHRILRLYVAYSYTGGSIVTDGWIDVTLSDGSTTTNWFVDPGLKFNFNLHGQYVYNDVVDISYFQNLANLNVNVTFQVSGGSGRNLNGFLRLYTNLAP